MFVQSLAASSRSMHTAADDVNATCGRRRVAGGGASAGAGSGGTLSGTLLVWGSLGRRSQGCCVSRAALVRSRGSVYWRLPSWPEVCAA